MKILRGFITGILSFLLFIFLIVFGLVFTLDRTALNANFVSAEINKLDLPALAKEVASQQLPKEYKFAAPAIDNIVTELQPWLKQQTSAVIHSGYDYILHRSDTLSVVIPLEPAKDKLKTGLKEAFLKLPPAELQGASPATLEQYFNEFYQQFSQEIPSTFELNERMLPPDVQNAFQEIRIYTAYYTPAYWGLIALIIIFMLLIFVANGNVRGTARSLGITFALYGAIDFALTWAANRYASPYLQFPGIPSSLQSWISQLFSDLLTPMQIFNIGLLIVGVILLVVSFVYPKKLAEE